MRVSSAIIQVFSSPSLSHLYETPPLRCSRFQSLSLSLFLALPPCNLSLSLPTPGQSNTRLDPLFVALTARNQYIPLSAVPSIRDHQPFPAESYSWSWPSIENSPSNFFLLSFFSFSFVFDLVSFFFFFFLLFVIFFPFIILFLSFGPFVFHYTQLHQLIQHFSGKTPRPSTITYKVSISWRRGGLWTGLYYSRGVLLCVNMDGVASISLSFPLFFFFSSLHFERNFIV